MVEHFPPDPNRDGCRDRADDMQDLIANKITSLDAGTTLRLHIERHWPGASEFFRSPNGSHGKLHQS